MLPGKLGLDLQAGKTLALKIKKSGFKPDLTIGIVRGGLVPARVVCDFLLQKDLAAIKVDHWGIAATLGKVKSIYVRSL
jgi:hypoxanthine phosphoribosyltransferase